MDLANVIRESVRERPWQLPAHRSLGQL